MFETLCSFSMTPPSHPDCGLYPASSSTKEDPEELITTIEEHGIELHCSFNPLRQERYISYQGNKYTEIKNLITASENIANNLLLIAKALIYLINEQDSRLINDPDSFRDEYEKQYSKNPRLSQYDHYNIKEIEIPKITNDVFIFFIEKDFLPRRISCKWPIELQPQISCEILQPEP